MTRDDIQVFLAAVAFVAAMVVFMPRHDAPACRGPVETLFTACE